MSRQQELEAFKQAVRSHIEPIAAQNDLSVDWIDQGLFSMHTTDFSFNIYCAGGHRYGFTAAVAPTYTAAWNPPNEIGFPWLVKYVGKHSWKHDDYTDLTAFLKGIEELAAIIPEYVTYLRNASPSFWQDFSDYVSSEIEKGIRV